MSSANSDVVSSESCESSVEFRCVRAECVKRREGKEGEVAVRFEIGTVCVGKGLSLELNQREKEWSDLP